MLSTRTKYLPLGTDLGTIKSTTDFSTTTRQPKFKWKVSAANTKRWPSPPPRSAHSIDAGDLEPDIARCFPGVDVCAVGDPGHVEGQWSKVRDLSVGDESQRSARFDGRCRSAGAHLEAPHVLRIDVGHAMVSLIILSLPDGGPFLSLGDAVDDDSREAVWRVVSRGLGPRQTSFCDQAPAPVGFTYNEPQQLTLREEELQGISCWCLWSRYTMASPSVHFFGALSLI